jgi:hypothetical protein
MIKKKNEAALPGTHNNPIYTAHNRSFKINEAKMGVTERRNR